MWILRHFSIGRISEAVDVVRQHGQAPVTFGTYRLGKDNANCVSSLDEIAVFEIPRGVALWSEASKDTCIDVVRCERLRRRGNGLGVLERREGPNSMAVCVRHFRDWRVDRGSHSSGIRGMAMQVGAGKKSRESEENRIAKADGESGEGRARLYTRQPSSWQIAEGQPR